MVLNYILVGCPCYIAHARLIKDNSTDEIKDIRGTQRSIVSKYARSVSDGFLYALEACLVNLELSYELFICPDVLGELWSSRKF